MQDKKITLGIPVYNGFNNVRNLLNSIQIHANNLGIFIEYIIIDDCSCEAFSKLLISFSEQRNILYLRNDNNMGIPYSWNRIVAAAKSEFVFIFNDDVIINDPDWVRRSIFAFEQNPFIGIVSFSERRIDRTGRTVAIDHRASDRPLLHCWPSGPFFGIRKSLWTQVRQPDGSVGFWSSLRTYCEDWDFGLEMNERGYATCVLRNVVMDHLRNQTTGAAPLGYAANIDLGSLDLEKLSELSRERPTELQRPARNRFSDWLSRTGFKKKTPFVTRQELSAAMLFRKWKSSLLSQDPASYASKRAQIFDGKEIVYLDVRNEARKIPAGDIIYSKMDDAV